ncbi:MAG: hypothetical protein UT55_C0044G0002 [Candidatus Peregrinibacteria bacterium GW2011_GWE2_39_6]|nr:MAG: hypothetical protein UT36_C0001G0183 [Candidatus Peregrinibacteria bacterium GW2011_GWF2_39_17]KKR25445.1 MAG: hypothetical protein UT55_C0044G0002 [Candidatus Peregrinibacteria bacterium GW2011_GWE2_39_6]HCW32622.1 hypothetical protein [Candidatus Peregrinibacteria bacterium]
MPHLTCTQCPNEILISPEDFQLYKKLAVSPPTLCPACRQQRRLAWRNDRAFYQRRCDKSGKEFVSMYAPDKPYKIYHPDAWYSENWDALDYGRAIDFNRPFFEQFKELSLAVPRLGIDIVHCENSYFCNYCGDDKNCYLDIAGEANEDCYFNLFTKHSKNCVDTTFAYSSELCYETIQVYNSYNVNYSMYCDDCSDCFFCYDLKGCRNCIFSSNLRQKEYFIFNKPYSKEDYEKIRQELNFGSYSKTQQSLKKWTDFRKQKAIYRDAYLLNCENSSGNDLKNCKNTHASFNATNCEDCKYLYDVLDAKDCQDLNYSLYKPEVAYELISTLQMRYSAFSMASHYNHDVYYCDMVNNSSDLFGCIGLNRKKHCILNKQYSPEEYQTLKERLIAHMKETKEWGEFFPAALSPWAYNETVANEYFPLTEKEALKKGFNWYNNPNESHKITQNYLTPDHVRDAPDSLIEETLTCAICQKNFKIIRQELTYYREKGLPIPHSCPDCRHKARFSLRPARQLNERTCSNCQTSIKSVFLTSREEKVYCEKCYQETLY